MSDFASRIADLRKEHHLTQNKLSEVTGLSKIGIQSYERRIRKPTMDALIALADAFDVSIDYLVGRSDNPARH